MSARVAWVSADRAIHLLEPDGVRRQLTGLADESVMWASWGAAKQAPASHTWPTFSPDGRWVAAFEITAERGSVLVTDLEGVQSSVVIELPDQLPIYLQWSGDGERIAVVSQLRDDLLLTVGRVDGRSPQKVLAKGSPLFFTWTDDGRVATFIGGGSPNARMMLLDPEMRRATEVMPGIPGDFCAPVQVGDTLFYGAHDNGVGSIMAFRDGQPVRPLPGGDGLMAFVASPDGTRLARAVAPAGDGTPYQSLSVIDIATGEEHLVVRMECLAFLWAGDDGLVVARVDSDRGLVEWVRVDLSGHQTHLIDLLPSRDMRFYLRFFEQYASSHPIVDPSGRHLLLAGIVRGRGSGSRVWRVPIRGGEPEDIGDGRFAAFGPELRN
ncbi:MAG: PD40 domain-containing protein [Myxococcales bacterium]|nr:PD40 domain-containing protein [Myxococcales bacterium]